MALTEEQTIIDSKIRSLGYHVKFDHQLREMLADSTKKLDLYKEGKQGVEDKEESLNVKFEELWVDHYEVDGDGKIINQPIEDEPRISETIPKDINGLSVSEVKALYKDLHYQQHLSSWQDKIDIVEGNISLIKKSIFQTKITVVSIFINKPQFNRKIAFKSYPRLLAKDIKILKNHVFYEYPASAYPPQKKNCNQQPT